MTNPAHRISRFTLAALMALLAAVPELSAAKVPKAKARNADAADAVDPTDVKMSKREEKTNAKLTADNATDTESRQLARLRERLGVTDDAEWTVISERIAKMEELRRGAATGAGGMRALATPSDKVKRNGRADLSAKPELDALRAAVTDQYPDAEIKARLARAHEVHQQREEQLRKAQADLRAVLSVRQEAIVVMVGLLPP